MEEFVLEPEQTASHLSPEEVLLRLVNAFDYVLVSRSLGEEIAKEARKKVAILKELGATKKVMDKWKKDNAPGKTLFLEVRDDPKAEDVFLKLIVTPRTSISVGFESESHYRKSRKFVARAARALGYVVGEG